MFGVPVVEGTPGSKLGASLAACRLSGFVAGAPGTGTAWSSTLGTPPFQGNYLGRTVACEGTTSTRPLAGGAQGVREDISGMWNGVFTSGSVLSLSRGHDLSLPILVGRGGFVELYDRTSGTLTTTLDGGGAPSFGMVVHWSPSQPIFLVTKMIGEVRIYNFNATNGNITLLGSIPNMTAGFGRALALGDFSPAAGMEIAIGAERSVYLYNMGSSTLLPPLMGSDSSFGTSLAVEFDGVAPGLDSLLVGEPATNTVYRYVGTARSIASALPNVGARFGASIAVDSTSTELAVGAPDYNGNGAVFIESRQASTRMGQIMTCTVGSACITSGCIEGTCQGEVFCNTAAATPACTPDQFCDGRGRCLLADGGLADAGRMTIDAGTPDASVSFDAGAPDASISPFDAGTPDAGISPEDGGSQSTDAGSREDAGPRQDAGLGDAGSDAERMTPLLFSTSGCTSCSETGALPLLLLGLLLARRRHLPLRGRGIA